MILNFADLDRLMGFRAGRMVRQGMSLHRTLVRTVHTEAITQSMATVTS